MTKLIVTLLLLLTFSTAALAGPTQPPRADASAPRQHHYWLSQDFQRLVFWQAPAQGGQRR